MKKLDKGCLINWLKKQTLFWNVIFPYSTQWQWTISWLDGDMWWKVDFIRQLVITPSVFGPRDSKALPKARFVPKQVMVSLVVCCLSDPLYLSASQYNHYIWEVYSANWWDAPKTARPAASIGQQKGSSYSPGKCLTACLSHNQCFRSWTNCATKFCLICQVLLTTH